MRQILYASSSNPANSVADVTAILEQSRHNNAIDGITGLLWTDGLRFVQVIEGPADSVVATFGRIQADVRHRAVTVLVDKPITTREFGDWTMAHQQSAQEVGPNSDQNFGMSSSDYAKRVSRILDSASDEVRSMFLDLVQPSTIDH